nr:hypothetical protein [Tanacetum cinerariifolium]
MRAISHIARNCTARPRRRDAAYLQTQLLIAQKEEAKIQLQAEEFDFMAAAGDLDEINEVNANYILKANLHASTSGTQLDKAPVYDTDSSAEVHLNDNCYDNEIFNMFTQEEQNTDLLEPIPEPQLVPQNEIYVTSVSQSMVQSEGTVKTSFAPNKETHAHQETVYRNLVDQVSQVNMVNCNMRATNAELKSELSRYKIQEQRVEISQEKYDKLEKNYQKSVYQEQCLTRKINVLHLSSAKQITTLNDEISNLYKQLSKEKSSISSLMEEKKKLKHDFKTREDKFLDKKVDIEAKIKDLENILLKRDQTVQTMHILNPKPDSFYHPNQKLALGYLNPSYLKKAQLKQQSLYNGNLLLEEHDPPAVYDSEETLELAQEHLSDDPTPSVARKFLNEVKSSLVTLQHVVKQKLTLEVHNWSSSAHKEKLESMIVELEFQVVNYEREINHLKTTYKNLFDSITSNRAHAKLHNLIYENAQLRAWVFENTSESMNNTSGMSVTPHVDKPKISAVTTHSKKLHASIPSHSVPQPREFNVMKHRNVIAPGMFKINPSQTSRVDLVPNKQSSASIRTNPITNCHLKTTYKNLFDSITSNRAHAKLHNLIYENAQLRAWVFENTFEPMKNTSGTSVTPNVDKPKLSVVTLHSKKFHASILSHSVPQPKEFNVVKHRNVIAPGMFKINPSNPPRVDLEPNKQSSASIRTNPITNFQCQVIVKENVSSNMVNASSTRLVHTVRTRRPQPKGNTRNDRSFLHLRVVKSRKM